MNILKNKFIGALAVIVVLFVTYTYFFVEPDTGAVLSSSNSIVAPDSEGDDIGDDILALLVDLKAIDLNRAVLDDTVFRSLNDFSIPISPKPQGRPNPFAPVSPATPATPAELDE